MLYAVAFGSDGMNGDSAFHFEPIRVSDKIILDFKYLLGMWARKNRVSLPSEVVAVGFHDEDEFDNDEPLPVGFWILDFKTKDAIDKAFEYDQPGNDSALYRMTYSCKVLCSLLCTKTVKKVPSI